MSPPSTLFRPEVMQAQSAAWLGTVQLGFTPSYRWIAAVALVLGGLFIAFAALGEANRKTRLTGLLVPSQGSINIAAPQAGVLLERRIAEGQAVQAGDVLLVLGTERQSMAGSAVADTSALVAQQIEARRQTQQAERGLRQQQSQQKHQLLEQRISALQAELRKLAEESALLASRVHLAQTSVERQRGMVADGYAPQALLQSKQEELLDAQSRQQSLERTRLGLGRELASSVGEQQALAAQLQVDLAAIDRSLASLVQEATENTARATAVITAPASGTITALSLQPGQAISLGQPLATLVPGQTEAVALPLQAALQAHLYAPSHTAGFLKPGQAVYLRYAAYPYQKFGLHRGVITSISATPFAPSELPANISQQIITQVGTHEAVYRVNVRLDAASLSANGETVALRPGLTLEADVLQERRKIWEWVLEPILAARQQLKVLNADLPEPPVSKKQGG